MAPLLRYFAARAGEAVPQQCSDVLHAAGCAGWRDAGAVEQLLRASAQAGAADADPTQCSRALLGAARLKHVAAKSWAGSVEVIAARYVA